MHSEERERERESERVPLSGIGFEVGSLILKSGIFFATQLRKNSQSRV